MKDRFLMGRRLFWTDLFRLKEIRTFRETAAGKQESCLGNFLDEEIRRLEKECGVISSDQPSD